MSEEVEMTGDTRVSVSLAQLRAELVAMELRIVDRLNGALANKADRAIMEQIAARQSDGLSRLSILEQKAVLKDGPIAHEIDSHSIQLNNLQAVAGYRKWLWAHTAALAGIAIAAVGIWVQAGGHA